MCAPVGVGPPHHSRPRSWPFGHAPPPHLPTDFSAGTREDWRDDADDFPAAAVGEALGDWEGEVWVDVNDEVSRFGLQYSMYVVQHSAIALHHVSRSSHRRVLGYDNKSCSSMFLLTFMRPCGITSLLLLDFSCVDVSYVLRVLKSAAFSGRKRQKNVVVHDEACDMSVAGP